MTATDEMEAAARERATTKGASDLTGSGRPLVEMRGIVKTFPGVKALTDVDLTLHEGEVLGLLGENGAGKSTLMNVLGGVLRPDSGTIRIAGEEVHFQGVLDAQKAGVAFVHQELALEPYLTVAENVFIGRELKNGGGLVSQRLMDDQAVQYLDMVGLNVDPESKVNALSLGQQQMIELAKALALRSRVIVLDEPTSSLSEKEVEDLFRVVRRLKASGLGIIYISHKMSEIFDLTDTVMVMRDGACIGTCPTAATDEDELVHQMVGRDIGNYYCRTFNRPGPVALSIRDYSCQPWQEEVSLDVRCGEVLGLYGLIGAGRSELFESILGFRKGGRGTISVFGHDLEGTATPARMHELGVALVPEDRKTEGLFLSDDVMFNCSIASLGAFMSGLRVDKDRERDLTRKAIEGLNIKTPSMGTAVGNLSGGNQQKVVLGKWLATSPKILILDEPTRGIDVGAKAEIYRIIDGLAAKGVAVVMISSELNEVMNMSDRLAVMRAGRVTALLDRQDYSQDGILRWALG